MNSSETRSLTDRYSIPHSNHDVAPNQERMSEYHYRFAQDVHTHIIPYRSSSKSEHHFILEPNERGVFDMVVKLFSTPNSHSRNDLTNVLDEHIRWIAGSVAWHGQIHFEITSDLHNTDTSSSAIPSSGNVRIRLERIWGKVYRTPFGYFQIAVGPFFSKSNRIVARIPTKHIWEIQVPEELGGMQGYKRLSAALSLTSVPTLPESRSFFNSGEQSSAFSNHRELTNLSIANATRLWGWSSVDMWSDYGLDYYVLYKRLLFERAMAILREHILSESNILLEMLGIPCSIKVDGIRTRTEIEVWIEKLRTGKESFQSVQGFIWGEL